MGVCSPSSTADMRSMSLTTDVVPMNQFLAKLCLAQGKLGLLERAHLLGLLDEALPRALAGGRDRVALAENCVGKPL